MTPADALLLAAFDLATAGRHPFTVADLAVAAWARCPQSFGMSGYKDRYPDIRRVAAALGHCGPQNQIGRGHLERVGWANRTRYRLTPEGRAAAGELAHRLATSQPAVAAVPENEVCGCGHLRADHFDLMIGTAIVDVGHGECGKPECRCAHFRFVRFVKE